MGIRETLNKNPSITTGATIAIIVVALIAIIWQLMSGRPSFAPAKSFYTVDDGATRFVDEATKSPPFDKDGQKAVRMYVFKCPDGKEFIAFEEKYTDDAIKKINAQATEKNPDPMLIETLSENGMEVKKPGAGNKWYLKSTAEGQKIMSEIKCPDGSTTGLEPVLPN